MDSRTKLLLVSLFLLAVLESVFFLAENIYIFEQTWLLPSLKRRVELWEKMFFVFLRRKHGWDISIHLKTAFKLMKTMCITTKPDYDGIFLSKKPSNQSSLVLNRDRGSMHNPPVQVLMSILFWNAMWKMLVLDNIFKISSCLLFMNAHVPCTRLIC